MSQFFRQCTMTRRLTIADGLPVTQVHVAWIPEQFAHEGKVLRILDYDKWVDGWEVTFVGKRLSEEYVREQESDHKHQREASDI